MEARGLDQDTGTVRAVLRGKLADMAPDLSEEEITVYTAREGDYVVASAIWVQELEE